MNKIKLIIISVSMLLSLTASSCKKEKPQYEWEWEQHTPEKVLDKPCFLWVSSGANFNDFANSKDNIRRDLTLAKNAGFTDIVVDVRPTGDVLFQTSKSDYVQWLGAYKSGSYIRIDRTADWDYLGAFIELGHELGLKIHAGFNTFVGGQKNPLGQVGLLYKDPSKKSWATERLTDKGVVNEMDVPNFSGNIFLNPVNTDAQNYIISLLEDLAKNYPDLDGVFLDRGRFEGLNTDFSDYTRKKFEAFLGQSVANFPADVMDLAITDNNVPAVVPVLFKKWLEFRAKTIYDFMQRARDRVKAINPKINFGVYVGGWYSTYLGPGVNWASKDYNTAADYPRWASANYRNYGYAALMDIIIIGAYASPDKVLGSSEWTIQGFCAKAKNKIKNDAIVVGGPDIGNGKWADNSKIELYNSAIKASVGAVMDVCDGYYLFDMIHLKNRNQWNYVREGLNSYQEK